MLTNSMRNEMTRLGIMTRLKELDTERAMLMQELGQSKPAEQNDGQRGQRKMSVSARKRISDAQKKRWAAQKAAVPAATGKK